MSSEGLSRPRRQAGELEGALNVITVEDPVEYNIPDCVQLEDAAVDQKPEEE